MFEPSLSLTEKRVEEEEEEYFDGDSRNNDDNDDDNEGDEVRLSLSEKQDI